MSIEEVRALVVERQRYDDWLSALEAKRSETPLRVYERVHGDYLGRRADVMARLQTHVGALASLGDDLEQRLADLESRLSALEDERAEAMLRNLVGEYDADRWENVRQDVESKIASLGEERGALLTEFDDVRTLLASARVEPEPAPPEVPVVPESDVIAESVQAEVALVSADDEDLAFAASLTPAASPAVPTPAVPTPAVPVASMPTPVVSPIVPTPVAPIPATPTPRSATPASGDESLLDIDVSGMMDGPPRPANHEDVLADVAAMFDTSSIAAVPEPAPSPVDEDPLAMFGDVSGPADAGFVQSLEGIRVEAESPARMDSRTDSRTDSRHDVRNDADAFDDLAFLRSVTQPGSAPEPAPAPSPSAAAPTSSNEPQKTLRCTECGTMNLPTEWYCERCGGELAAF